MKPIITYFVCCILLISCTTTSHITTVDAKNADMELNGKTIAQIPPSEVWQPRFVADPWPWHVHNTEHMQKYYPLDVASAVHKVIDGNPVNLVELRGWLRAVDVAPNNANDGGWRDWSYHLELDPEWLDAMGIDIMQVYKVGNIDLDTNSHSTEGLVIKVELNGWDMNGPNAVPAGDPSHGRPFNALYKNTYPLGWQAYYGPTPNIYWAYNPQRPLYWQDSLREDQYVRMYGSLVVDEPHNYDGNNQVKAAKKLWCRNCKDVPGGWDRDNPARWTEMHSPDLISILYPAGAKERKEKIVSVALSTAWPDVKPFTLTLTPPAYKPPNATHVEVREMVGPESDLGTLTSGNSNRSGALIINNGTTATISLTLSPSIGRPCLFRATYRVRWVP